MTAVLTPIGVTKFSQAAIGAIPPIVFTQGQVGSGALGGPTPATGLSHPEGTYPVTTVLVNGDQIEIGFSVPHDAGTFEINEIALLDSAGDVLLVSLVQPFTKHNVADEVQDVYFQCVLEHSNAVFVVVQTNPSAVYVTYGDLEELFNKLFKGVSHHTASIPTGSHQVDVTIPQVNTNKAYLQHNGTIGGVDPGVELSTQIHFVNSTTVRVSRFAVSGATYPSPWTVRFSVVEFGNPLEQP